MNFKNPPRTLIALGALLTQLASNSQSNIVAADHSFDGLWKLDAAKSQLAERTATFEKRASGKFHFETGDGRGYDYDLSGKQFPKADGGTVSVRELNPTTWEFTQRMNGRVLRTQTLSLEGDTITSKLKATSADGSTVERTTTAERVSGGPGLLGKWRWREVAGTPLTIGITTDGKNGITLKYPIAQESCAAVFDGKDYPIIKAGARSKEALAFERIDSTSFKMTTKSDGKPSSVEIFTLSADGKTLTDDKTQGSSGGKVKYVFEKDSTPSAAARAADQMPVKLAEELKGYERIIGEWLLTSANSNRGLAGIRADDLPETKRNALAKEGYDGAVIGAVLAGFPAEKAGLNVGDIIVRINTVPMHGKREVMQFLNQTTPGQSITLAILRDGKVDNFSLTLVHAQPVRIVTEAGPGGHSILTRGPVAAGISYIDPKSRAIVWLSVGPGGRVHRGTYSAEDLRKNEYAGSFEEAAPDGQIFKGISHTRWVNRDEFIIWDTDLSINGDRLPDGAQVQFQRVK